MKQSKKVSFKSPADKNNKKKIVNQQSIDIKNKGKKKMEKIKNIEEKY